MRRKDIPVLINRKRNNGHLEWAKGAQYVLDELKKLETEDDDPAVDYIPVSVMDGYSVKFGNLNMHYELLLDIF